MAIDVARKALTIKTCRTAIWTTGLAVQMDSLAVQRKMSHMLALLVRISVIKTVEMGEQLGQMPNKVE